MPWTAKMSNLNGHLLLTRNEIGSYKTVEIVRYLFICSNVLLLLLCYHDNLLEMNTTSTNSSTGLAVYFTIFLISVFAIWKAWNFRSYLSPVCCINLVLERRRGFINIAILFCHVRSIRRCCQDLPLSLIIDPVDDFFIPWFIRTQCTWSRSRGSFYHRAANILMCVTMQVLWENLKFVAIYTKQLGSGIFYYLKKKYEFISVSFKMMISCQITS